MEDKYSRRDEKYEELKQLQKLVAKITEIKDLAISYKRQVKINLLFIGISIIIVFISVFYLGHVFDSDNTFKKHLVLSVFLFAVIGIIFIILIVLIIIFNCKSRKIVIHLNTAISSLYTNDIIDHEVQENIEQYKSQIQMFSVHFYGFYGGGNQISYIPKLSMAKISFLQTKIYKLKKRQQRNHFRKHIN